MKYLQISIYINEADLWENRSLYKEILNFLYRHNVTIALVLRPVEMMTSKGIVKASLLHLHRKLPLIVQFIDQAGLIETILPELKKMAPNSFMTSNEVEIINHNV